MQHSWGFVSIRFPKRLPLTPSLLQPLPAARCGGGAEEGDAPQQPLPAGLRLSRGHRRPLFPSKCYPKILGKDKYTSLILGFHSQWFYFSWKK